MARDIIDDRLLGALHIKALTHQGFIHDPSQEHTAFQVGTLDALMEGRFDGDTTIGEVLSHGDFGLGTVQHLGGELIILDGDAFVVKSDQQIINVEHTLQTPFAVVCRFGADAEHEIADIDDTEIYAYVDALVPDPMTIVAVKVHGSFRDLLLRSIDEQQEPFPLLSEVVKDQSEWSVRRAHGTLVGFRFPDRTAGIEIPTKFTSSRGIERWVGISFDVAWSKHILLLIRVKSCMLSFPSASVSARPVLLIEPQFEPSREAPMEQRSVRPRSLRCDHYAGDRKARHCV